jgi:hypothetical protein
VCALARYARSNNCDYSNVLELVAGSKCETMKFMIHRHNECIVQLSDKNLLHSFHVLQGIVTMLREKVIEAKSPQSSLPTSEAWALHPKPEAISKEVDADGTYDHPLLLFCNVTSSSDAGEPSLRLFGATVLFNLALVSHLMGKIYGSERSLTLASKLYLAVKDLLQGTAFASCHPALLLLSLAIHNLGHLENSMGNYQGHCSCMKALWNLAPQMKMQNDPIEHHLLCSLRLWISNGPPVAAAA